MSAPKPSPSPPPSRGKQDTVTIATPKLDDLYAAAALIQHMQPDGKKKKETEDEKKTREDVMSQFTSALSVLAEKARELKLPGTGKTLWDGAKDIEPYDEVHQRKHKTRKAYADVMPIIERVMQDDAQKSAAQRIAADKNDGSTPEVPTIRIDTFGEVSQKGFQGDNKLYHIPRMLTREENDLLQKGVGQRAKALRAFVKDMSKHADKANMDCVKNGGFPLDLLNRIEARAGEQGPASMVKEDMMKPEDLYWSIWYGPDIIRGPDEDGKYQFFVLEDNLGYVGGFGDIEEARKILLRTFPELKPAIGPDKTSCFYDEMAKHYMTQVKEGEKVVLLYYQRKCAGAAETADNEDRRLVKIFEKRGVVCVPLPGDRGPPPNFPSMEIRGTGKNRKVFLVPKKDSGKKVTSPSKGDAEEGEDGPTKKKARVEDRVGLVILLSEPTDVEAGHPSTKLRSCVAEARARIEDLEIKVDTETKKAARAKMTVVKVTQKMDLESSDKKTKSDLQMKGKDLVWTIRDAEGKEVDRMKGPLSWNDSINKLSGKRVSNGEMFSCRFNEDTGKAFKKNWAASEYNHLPIGAVVEKQKAEELQSAIEAIGQLVGGSFNHKAPAALMRLLRLEDKKEWTGRLAGRRGLPGLLGAYYAGNVKIANGPGFITVEDKELCAHVDKLIRFFLNEEPILKQVPTLSFGKGAGANHELLHQVFDDPKAQENCVVKRVDGRGGDGVWVGAKLSRSDFLESRPQVENEPSAFIVQKYTCVSMVDGQIVDLRGPGIICSSSDEMSGGTGVAISPVLWGRGSDKNGNGKVNISDKGFEFTVCTSPDERLEAPAKVADKSKCKDEGGVLYERDLIEAVEDFTKGGSKIDLREAKKLWNMVSSDGEVTPMERKTIEYIVNYRAEFTKGAKEYLQGELTKMASLDVVMAAGA